MSRIPLALRLTLVFTLVIAAVLAGAGWLVYSRVASDLSGQLDQELRSRAQDVSALVRRHGSLATTRGRLVEQGESFAELIGPDGQVVGATRPIGRQRLVTGAELAVARRGPVFVNRSSVPGLDEPARLLAVPIASEHSVLVVGATRENRAETLNSLRDAFFVGGPLALLLAALAGYGLARAALRPIEAMRRRAAAISASSLDERLPLPPARDEVRRLGETLNAMLARIEDGLARERRFVADASHELRTPLALLKAELELALRRPRTEAELAAAVRSAAAEADRLARLADDLLVLARSDQGRLALQLSPVSARDVLTTVADRFSPAAPDGRRALEVDASRALTVVADRPLLEQALGNLVANALCYAPGTIRLTAGERNGDVELHVVDSGGGFPPDFLPRAFDRFSRADGSRSGDGAGLGLAIVSAIAVAHGGQASAANRANGGADVWLLIPGAERVG